MLARRIALGVGVVLTAATTGCGGSGAVSPTATVHEFYSALGNGDGDTACSLLSSTAQQRYISGSGTCAQNVRFVASLLKPQLASLRIGTATVHGSTATVPASLPQKQFALTLQLMGGHWVITSISNP